MNAITQIIPKERSEAEIAAKRLRNRHVLKVILSVCVSIDVILGGVLVYILFLHLSYFNLQQIDIVGQRRLSRTEVIEAAELEYGVNLLTIDLTQTADRLKRHPWIRSAGVYRRLPGRLSIEIDERIPRGVLAAERLYYVDDQGEAFSRVLPGDSVDFTLFTGINAEDLKTGSPEVQEMIRKGFNLLDLIERSGTDPDSSGISEIQISLHEGLTLRTRHGRAIVFGSNDFEVKLLRFERLKQFLIYRGEWGTARIINLDFEDRAIVRSDKARHQG
jgi:cell division protein FtsQ